MDRFFIENHSAMAGCSNLWCSNSSAPFYVTSKVATQLYPLVAEEWLRTVQLTPFSEKCTHCTATLLCCTSQIWSKLVDWHNVFDTLMKSNFKPIHLLRKGTLKTWMDFYEDLSKICEHLDFPAHLPKNDMLLRKIKQRLGFSVSTKQ